MNYSSIATRRFVAAVIDCFPDAAEAEWDSAAYAGLRAMYPTILERHLREDIGWAIIDLTTAR